MIKIILSAVAALVITGAIWGAYQYPKAPEQSAGTTSGTGNSYHMATFAFNPTTASATTSSILNSDSQDRIVLSSYVSCSGVGTSQTAYTGAGLANLTFTIATTSTANPAALGNTAYVLQQNLATSTTESSVASTSISKFATGNAFRWQAGTYMTVSSNATNTAACVVSIPYSQGLGI